MLPATRGNLNPRLLFTAYYRRWVSIGGVLKDGHVAGGTYRLSCFKETTARKTMRVFLEKMNTAGNQGQKLA